MYTNVHMVTTVPITEFRKDLFKYANLVELENYEIEVEKKGKIVFKVTKSNDNLKTRAEKALDLANKMVGSIKFNRKLFRNKREREYVEHLGDDR